MRYIGAIPKKGGDNMSTEADKLETRKAMAYDLCNIIDERPEQTSYTPEEIKKLIKIYVASTAQQ